MNDRSTADRPKTVLELILDWSEGRPEWQRDALRRIIVAGSANEADIAEIVQLCRKENGAVGIGLEAKPLAKADLPANPGAGEDVTLLSISAVSGVNRLAPGQVLAFQPTGLTIIYGDNGAGKSGYSRILKRACGARARGTILPNAFDDAAPPQAQADFSFAIGGATQPKSSWTDGDTPHEKLSAISIFDRECGSVHIRDKSEIAFRPFGLDIPDELASLCQQVKDYLSAELQQLEQARDQIFRQPTWKPETAVGRFMSSIVRSTDVAPLQLLSQVSDEERDRHTRLSVDLLQDPTKAAREQEIFADSLGTLAKSLRGIELCCSDIALADLKEKAIVARTKRSAANVAAEQATGATALDGVGGEVWRTLWEAARKYSELDAYPGREFPFVENDALCVLCNQSMDVDARRRLVQFEAFVRGETERQAKAAEDSFAARKTDFDRLRIRALDVVEQRQRIALKNPEVAASILSFLASARLRVWGCRRSLEDDEPLSIRALALSPANDVDKIAEDIRAYARELRKAVVPEERAKLEFERDELADRLAAGFLTQKASTEIERLQNVSILTDAIATTSTNAITKLGNQIADQAITPKIRDRFQSEIVRLAADRVRVEVTRSGGKFGSPFYEVKFFANPKAKVASVLSEGEQSCVALAAFLTELAIADHNSALVFDDPVTSLDHRWRKKVAERLSKEASVRQVIVFTHDLVFLNDLRDLVDQSTPLKIATVSIGPSGAGMVSEGLPWSGKSVWDRLDKLEKDARGSRTNYDADDEAAYSDDVFRLYSGLRATWERAIEDIAFGGVLLRHRDYVNSKHLRRAVALTSEDCDVFDAGFGRCCDIIDSHDPSRARGDAPPTPTDMLADIATLRDWVDSLRKRQKDS